MGRFLIDVVKILADTVCITITITISATKTTWPLLSKCCTRPIWKFLFANCFCRYSSINIWEISLPPPVIKITENLCDRHNALIEEIKTLSQKGHDLFLLIQEKVAVIPGEELEGVGNVWQVLLKEQSHFKLKVSVFLKR